MNSRAFLMNDLEGSKYKLTYVHNPQRWSDNLIASDNPIRNIENWSKEIKYLNESNSAISNAIKKLPNNVGGIYMFYIKGINLPFIENYILYIGRCQYTGTQNIRKRAREYFKDKRDLIKAMFKLWGEHLYYRYFPDTDNEAIIQNEVQLIRAIVPYFNETIPDKIEIKPTVPAF